MVESVSMPVKPLDNGRWWLKYSGRMRNHEVAMLKNKHNDNRGIAQPLDAWSPSKGGII